MDEIVSVMSLIGFVAASYLFGFMFGVVYQNKKNKCFIGEPINKSNIGNPINVFVDEKKLEEQRKFEEEKKRLEEERLLKQKKIDDLKKQLLELEGVGVVPVPGDPEYEPKALKHENSQESKIEYAPEYGTYKAEPVIKKKKLNAWGKKSKDLTNDEIDEAVHNNIYGKKNKK